MYVCPECASSIDSSRLHAGRHTCPDCGAPLRQDAQRQWIDVARVANLAEAGFLTDELVGLGIDAQIYQLQDFSASSGRWGSLYLIRVPATASREAAARIRQHLSEDADEPQEEAVSYSWQTSTEAPLDTLLWRPVVLVILAGVSSFVLGQRFSDREPKVDRRPPRDSLASAIATLDQPLVSEALPGRPRHRLTFDRQRDRWLLDTDQDGDGRYDFRREFQASGAAW